VRELAPASTGDGSFDSGGKPRALQTLREIRRFGNTGQRLSQGPFLRFQSPGGILWLVVALVRILVDGYSLLHGWPELAPGRPRHSAAARDELVQRLTLYQDAAGTPITIFFDGAGARSGNAAASSRPELEVLYSRNGQTADQMIERAAHRFSPYGEVLAVTDDYAERDTVIALGGLASSCASFIQTVENTLADVADDIKIHNRQERHRYRRAK
jgi:predicted RNA-binding protein with PIN domain